MSIQKGGESRNSSEDKHRPANTPDVAKAATSGRAGAMTWAYRTILTLLSATLLFSILAMVLQPRPQNPPQLPADVNSDEVASFKGDHWLKQHADRRWIQGRERLSREPWPETNQAIEERIDMAFVPVYESIPGFLDRHYSWRGQYGELAQKLLGTLEEEIEARLYAGFTERLVTAEKAVVGVMNKEMRTKIEDWIRREPDTAPPGLKLTYKHMLEMRVADTVERLSVSALPTAAGATVVGTGGAVAGAVGAKVVAKNMASATLKTLGKVGSGYFAKSAGVATGAAMGSVLGPIGTVVGGVFGGLAAWLAIDVAVVNTAEYFTREDLKRRLIELVDEHKKGVKSDFSKAFAERKLEALGPFTPSELRSRQ